QPTYMRNGSCRTKPSSKGLTSSQPSSTTPDSGSPESGCTSKLSLRPVASSAQEAPAGDRVPVSTSTNDLIPPRETLSVGADLLVPKRCTAETMNGAPVCGSTIVTTRIVFTA